MKYQTEYDNSKSKKEFIKLVLKNYPKLKYSTAERRYYDYKVKLKYPSDEKTEPSILKMLLLQDAKKLKQKITREFLLIYGFTPYEINWLEEKKLI